MYMVQCSQYAQCSQEINKNVNVNVNKYGKC